VEATPARHEVQRPNRLELRLTPGVPDLVRPELPGVGQVDRAQDEVTPDESPVGEGPVRAAADERQVAGLAHEVSEVADVDLLVRLVQAGVPGVPGVVLREHDERGLLAGRAVLVVVAVAATLGQLLAVAGVGQAVLDELLDVAAVDDPNDPRNQVLGTLVSVARVAQHRADAQNQGPVLGGSRERGV